MQWDSTYYIVPKMPKLTTEICIKLPARTKLMSINEVLENPFEMHAPKCRVPELKMRELKYPSTSSSASWYHIKLQNF